MNKTRYLLFDTIPSWYKLLWNPAQNTLQIHIAEAYIEALPIIPENSPITNNAKEKISHSLFSSFSLDLCAGHFGFNKSIRRLGEARQETNFVTFEVALPLVHVLTGLVCKECNGTGEQNTYLCFPCNGSGIEMKYDWDKAYATTESLQILFWLLDMGLEVDTQMDVPQWFTLNLAAERDLHGSSLGGALSKDGSMLFRDIITAGQEHCVALERCITEALKHSWWHMMGRRDFDSYNLRSEIRDDASLFLTCPGDAAGVYINNEGGNRCQDRGCDISCHNMDNPAQALACLAGLAVFSEALEQAWKETRCAVSK